jgi:hypothetical protein
MAFAGVNDLDIHWLGVLVGQGAITGVMGV